MAKAGDKDKRTGWMRKLKVGDYVGVDMRTGWGCVVAIVATVSPTGYIAVDHDSFVPRQFLPTGAVVHFSGQAAEWAKRSNAPRLKQIAAPARHEAAK